MAKNDKLKKAAELMFIDQGKNQKEIALTLAISEQTVSKWANAGKWKLARDARTNSTKKRADDIKAVIANLAERRLDIFKEIELAKESDDKNQIIALNREAVAIGQETAMYSKALEKMDSEQKKTLSVYLEVMDEVFRSLQMFDANLYLQTLNFQEQHIVDVSHKLG